MLARFSLSVWISLLVGLLTLTTAQAQRSPGQVGIGLQVGQPSGLSLAVYKPNSIGLDVLAAWDLDNFFYLNPHGVFTSHLGNSERFHLFYGPGAYIGLYDEGAGGDQARLGISATGGLSVIFGALELYGRITPRLQLFDQTNARIGGGLGIRVYL